MYTIYSTPTCKYCTFAKKLLTDMKLEYTEITINSNEVLSELSAKLGYEPKTVPQIFLGEDHIGGYDDLAKSMKW